MKISKSTLGLAADYAVASELCRRNIYAQPTFGHQKRTDKPEKWVELDEHNVPVWTTELNRMGQPYRGLGVRPEQIEQHKECWGKIAYAMPY
jgi:hypothetical protein